MLKMPVLIKVTNSANYNGIYKLLVEYLDKDNFSVTYTNQLTKKELLQLIVKENDLEHLADIINNKLLSKEYSHYINRYELFETVQQIHEKLGGGN